MLDTFLGFFNCFGRYFNRACSTNISFHIAFAITNIDLKIEDFNQAYSY